MSTPMDEPLRSRRRVLGLAMLGAAYMGASQAKAAVAGCDAADTHPGRASMRKALNYVSPSKSPGKACSGCAFFSGASTCGKCQLLNNGPVAGDAVCSSWAPKA